MLCRHITYWNSCTQNMHAYCRGSHFFPHYVTLGVEFVETCHALFLIVFFAVVLAACSFSPSRAFDGKKMSWHFFVVILLLSSIFGDFFKGGTFFFLSIRPTIFYIIMFQHFVFFPADFLRLFSCNFLTPEPFLLQIFWFQVFSL